MEIKLQVLIGLGCKVTMGKSCGGVRWQVEHCGWVQESQDKWLIRNYHFKSLKQGNFCGLK
jgi:hypothetical protein